MKKKHNQARKKDADYCSMFCTTSCCNAHNTVIGGVFCCDKIEMDERQEKYELPKGK